MIKIDKIFVVHVVGNEERLRHINKQLSGIETEIEFMLRGNKADLNDEILNKYFTGTFRKISSEVSCAYKHILIFEEMIRQNISRALILEDDIILYPDFIKDFNTTIEELEISGLTDVFVSYENSTFDIIPEHRLIKGKYLYRKTRTRCTGAYLIDLSAARKIISYTHKHKIEKPIDWHLNAILNHDIISAYWCHPPLAEQASHNGCLDSVIDRKKKGILRKTGWYLKKVWKEKLFNRYR
jgi:glycosyl transferase, family 25